MAASAQVDFGSVDRRVGVYAGAAGYEPDGTYVEENDQDSATSTELSPFGANLDVSAAAPGASASSSATLSESLSPLVIQLDGGFSINASAGENEGAGAGADVMFDLNVAYRGISGQAFTATGTIAHSGPGNNQTVLGVLGEGVSVSNVVPSHLSFRGT